MKKEKIILVGAGEHAKMVIDNIEDIGNIEIFGIVTSIPEDVGERLYGYPIIGVNKEIDLIFSENRDLTGYFLTIGTLKAGNMRPREQMYQRLDKKYRAINIIHPKALISRHTVMGNGNIFEAYTKVANGTRIGSHCILNSFSAINHDQIIGDNVLIAGNVSMAGCSIGSNTIIADGASIGFKCSVGSHCIIGDGAVVTKDIPDGSIAYGNPAKVIRKNSNFIDIVSLQ